jgi:anti-sigma factor ChrR (cupin superfamily)
MKEISINPEERKWEDFAGYPRGTEMSVLRRDESGRIRTMLMKLGTNFSVGGHTNTIGEEQLILEGEIQSNGETYGRGSYRFIPEQTSHDSWTSEKGALVLVRWD